VITDDVIAAAPDQSSAVDPLADGSMLKQALSELAPVPFMAELLTVVHLKYILFILLKSRTRSTKQYKHYTNLTTQNYK